MQPKVYSFFITDVVVPTRLFSSHFFLFCFPSFLFFPLNLFLSPPISCSSLLFLQFLGWWQFHLRCGLLRTTLHLCHWWKFTNNAVPKRASSTTTLSHDIMTVWPLCRLEAHKPATRYKHRSQTLSVTSQLSVAFLIARRKGFIFIFVAIY